MARQYYGIEDLALTPAQRSAIVQALQAAGENDSPYPNRRNHWRVRLDSRAVIFEGAFRDDDWTAENLTARLAAVLGVDPALISSRVVQTDDGPVITFSAGGTDRLRMIAFGGLLTTWRHSQEHTLEYIAAHEAEWEEV